MSITINPTTGQLDFLGDSGGGGGIPVPNYFATFNGTTDWGSPSGGVYTRTITAATHGKGLNPIVNILELSGSDYQIISITYKIDPSGNISFEALQSPDNRFAGKIIISENN